jgi:nucleoside-diphosphate-sugar epimerase
MNRTNTKEDALVSVVPVDDRDTVAALGTDLRHVLVIGGAGYVGSVLVRDLLDRFDHVTVMDAFLFGDEGVREITRDARVDIVRGDLRDIEAIVRAARDADAVVHLGGLVGDPACALDERLTLEVNLESTRTIVRAARGLGVRRFVFASSCSVYGSSPDLLDEDSPLEPVSLYATSKMESERIILEFQREDFAPVILRFGTFYGLSPRPRFDLIVNMLAAKASGEGAISVFGGGQWRPFVHVADGSDAIIRALTAPEADVTGEIFNVGSERENYTIQQVADVVAEIIPGTAIETLEDRQDPANYRVSFEKIRNVLGFEPRHSLREAIDEIHRAVSSGSVSYLAERYSNVRAMASVVAEESATGVQPPLGETDATASATASATATDSNGHR